MLLVRGGHQQVKRLMPNAFGFRAVPCGLILASSGVIRPDGTGGRHRFGPWMGPPLPRDKGSLGCRLASSLETRDALGPWHFQPV